MTLYTSEIVGGVTEEEALSVTSKLVLESGGGVRLSDDTAAVVFSSEQGPVRLTVIEEE